MAGNPKLCLFVDIKHGTAEQAASQNDKKQQLRFREQSVKDKKIIEENKQEIKNRLIFLNQKIQEVI